MTRQLRYTIIVSLLTLSGVVLSAYKSTAQRQTELPALQEQERMIMKKTDFNPPVRIKAIKAKGRSVALDAKFVDDDDWLKGLTVRLDNSSGKSLSSVRIEVYFHRPEDQAQDPPAIWYLDYGDYPFHYKTEEEIPPSRVKRVLAGESVEVRLSDSDFNDMERFLKSTRYSSGTNAIELRITNIGFSDGTVWSGGRIFRRDPESPRGGAL